MDTPIAKFFATVKFVPDKASIRQTERIFNKMLFGNNPRTSTATEKKGFADKFNSLLGGFKPNVSLIQKALDNSMRGRSKLTLQIDNFKINKDSLQKTVMQAAKGIVFPITPKAANVRTTNTTRTNSSGFGGGGNRFRITPSGVGLAAGGVGIFGGLGVGALNQSVRTLQNLPVMLTSVTGSEQRAAQELEFLNNLGNQVGATVASMAPDYTKMFASAMGTPLESQMQRGFSAFTRYGKVMGLDQEAMSGSYRARVWPLLQ